MFLYALISAPRWKLPLSQSTSKHSSILRTFTAKLLTLLDVSDIYVRLTQSKTATIHPEILDSSLKWRKEDFNQHAE
jgi:hypothetical protein